MRHHVRHVLTPENRVESPEIARQQVVQVASNPLEFHLEVLLNIALLIRRLEVGACEAARQVAQLAEQAGAPADAILTAAGQTKVDKLGLRFCVKSLPPTVSRTVYVPGAARTERRFPPARKPSGPSGISCA